MLAAAHTWPVDRNTLAIDNAEAFLASPSVGPSPDQPLRALAGKLLDLVLHHRLDKHFPHIAQQISQTLLRQLGDSRRRDRELNRHFVGLCPLRKLFRSPALRYLVLFLHWRLLFPDRNAQSLSNRLW